MVTLCQNRGKSKVKNTGCVYFCYFFIDSWTLGAGRHLIRSSGPAPLHLGRKDCFILVCIKIHVLEVKFVSLRRAAQCCYGLIEKCMFAFAQPAQLRAPLHTWESCCLGLSDSLSTPSPVSRPRAPFVVGGCSSHAGWVWILPIPLSKVKASLNYIRSWGRQ